MVGVVNPNSTQTYSQQLSYAQNATLEFSPGEYFPVESKISRTTTATGATSPPTASSPSTPIPNHPHSSSVSGVSIAGIVIGALALVLFAGTLLYMRGRQHSVGNRFRNRKPGGEGGGTQGRDSFRPTPGGLSEAQFASLTKSPAGDSGRQRGGADAYRNLSPAVLSAGQTRMGPFPEYQWYQGPEKEKVFEMGGAGAK